MHIQLVPNRSSKPTALLRESFRLDGKVCKRTLANLSSLPDKQIALIRAVLAGDDLCSASDLSARFVITNTRAHGHVQAVSAAMQQLKLPSLLFSTPCRERDLVMAMIASRIVDPQTKLATVRRWDNSTLASSFDVLDATEDDLYAAMDWLLSRQDAIQQKLAARHLMRDGLVLYDLSSSYMEGSCCPLAKRGYSRDGKRGTLQINYGLMADARGCPVAVTVHEGNTADATTFLPEVERVRTQFGLSHVVMVGDRGMISQKAIEALRSQDGMGWITALKSVSIRALVEQKFLQPGLFDERNLLAIHSSEYPGERLIACRNEALGRKRAITREALLAATERDVAKVSARVAAGRLSGCDNVGVAVGKVIDKHKMAKHFVLTVEDAALSFGRDEQSIAAEAALDGIYIIRTSVAQEKMSDTTCVANYKSLAQVERAFKTLKSIDLKVRPIHHRLESRVRAHIFLCMLAYYVEWHMREAWRPLMFADADRATKVVSSPVGPAKRSAKAMAKVNTMKLEDGSPVHDFRSLMASLATVTRNACRTKADVPEETPTFEVVTSPTAQQQHALDLIRAITL